MGRNAIIQLDALTVKRLKSFVPEGKFSSISTSVINASFKKRFIYPTDDFHLTEEQFLSIKQLLKSEEKIYVMQMGFSDGLYSLNNPCYELATPILYDDYQSIWIDSISIVFSDSLYWVVLIDEAPEGGEAFFIKCDVTNEQDIINSIEETVKRYGTIDILVNNAGMVDIRMLHEYSIDDWNRVMDLNVRSIFLSFKHAFPYLKQHEKSYVVNVGSISSFVGQDCTPVYTTSKGAVLNLSKSIGLDYARYGIRCNCVCPGITETPMLWKHLNTEKDPEEHYRNRLRRVPIGRQLYPEDIAKACLFFSCEDSSGITATSLIVDGGYLACAEWDTQK